MNFSSEQDLIQFSDEDKDQYKKVSVFKNKVNDEDLAQTFELNPEFNLPPKQKAISKYEDEYKNSDPILLDHEFINALEWKDPILEQSLNSANPLNQYDSTSPRTPKKPRRTNWKQLDLGSIELENKKNDYIGVLSKYYPDDFQFNFESYKDEGREYTITFISKNSFRILMNILNSKKKALCKSNPALTSAFNKFIKTTKIVEDARYLFYQDKYLKALFQHYFDEESGWKFTSEYYTKMYRITYSGKDHIKCQVFVVFQKKYLQPYAVELSDYQDCFPYQSGDYTVFISDHLIGFSKFSSSNANILTNGASSHIPLNPFELTKQQLELFGIKFDEFAHEQIPYWNLFNKHHIPYIHGFFTHMLNFKDWGNP